MLQDIWQVLNRPELWTVLAGLTAVIAPMLNQPSRDSGGPLGRRPRYAAYFVETARANVETVWLPFGGRIFALLETIEASKPYQRRQLFLQRYEAAARKGIVGKKRLQALQAEFPRDARPENEALAQAADALVSDLLRGGEYIRMPPDFVAQLRELSVFSRSSLSCADTRVELRWVRRGKNPVIHGRKAATVHMDERRGVGMAELLRVAGPVYAGLVALIASFGFVRMKYVLVAHTMESDFFAEALYTRVRSLQSSAQALLAG